MMRLRHPILTALLGIGAFTASTAVWAQSREAALDDWFAATAVPALVQSLREHPRFAGQRIDVAAVEGMQAAQSTAARSNGLAQTLAGTLRQTLRVTPGVQLAWRQSQQACEARHPADYRVVIDASAADRRGQAQVDIAIVDTHEQRWLSDFSHRWTGALNSAQRRLLSESVAVGQEQGTRARPFADTELDLLAESLAQRLDCELRVYADAGIVVAAPEGGDGEPTDNSASWRRTLGATPELVAQLLAQRKGVGVLDGREKTPGNALVLSARSQRISDDLVSVWVFARNHDQDGTQFEAASAQAYIALATGRGTSAAPVTARRLTPRAAAPGLAVPTVTVNPSLDTPIDALPERQNRQAPSADRPSGADVASGYSSAAASVLLPSAPRLLKPVDTSACRHDPWARGARYMDQRTDVSRGECFALELDVDREAVLFVLHEPLQCGRAETVRPAASGQPARGGAVQTLRFPQDTQRAFDARNGESLESFYFVAARDPQAATRIASQLERLPPGCDPHSARWREDYERWLSDLEHTMLALGPRADWQGFRVRHVN